MSPATSTQRETEYAILPRHGACLRCRKRKQKCDASKPECHECIAVRSKCQYEDENYKSRTQLLQDRIKELEEQIRVIEETKSASPIVSIPSQSNSSRGSQNPSPGPSSSSAGSLWGDDSRSPTTSPPSSAFSGSSSPLSPAIEHLRGDPKGLFSSQPWPSPDVTEKLLHTFFLRHTQCGFELHVGRVTQSLQPGSTVPVVPALLSAMLLVACHFVQDHKLQAWETAFLERTKSEIEDNIVRAHGGAEDGYNSLHHFQAMLLFGLYFYFKGRLLEGHFHTAQATRFGITLGLHRTTSRVFGQARTNETGQVPGIGRWHPRDSIELGEAINLWWTCYCWDMGGSTINGLPRSISFEEVTTVWPRPLWDFESGHPLPDDDYSIAALFDPDLCHIVADASRENIKSFMAKAFVLMRTALTIDTARTFDPHGTEEWWSEFERCDRSLDRFRQTMPPLHIARNLEELEVLVLCHTSVYCGEVQLHCTLGEYELVLGAQGDPRCIHPDGSLGGLSYDRCHEACRAVGLTASIVENIDMSYLHMFTGISWVCVSEMAGRDLARLRRTGQFVLAKKREQVWGVIESCMEKLLITYPLIKLQLEQLRSMKRAQILQPAGAN